VEEKRKFVEAYRLDIDPESTIYGCASCGVYVTLPKTQSPYSRTLISLGLLKLSEEQLAAYNSVNGEFVKETKGVTACNNGCFYNLFRNWLRGCQFDCSIENVLHSVPETVEALLCESCYVYTKPNSKCCPPMSLSAGVDYGLAWKFLPPLSFVEMLLLQSFTVFGHLFKATCASGVTIKGALIALRTNAKDIMLAQTKAAEDKVRGVPVLIPRQTINMDIQFLGQLYLWERIKSDSDKKLEFVKLHQKVFNVSSERLTIWAKFLINNRSTQKDRAVYVIDESALKQKHLDKIVDQMIQRSTAHDSLSMHARIEEDVRQRR